MKEVHNNKKAVNQDVTELGQNIQKQREFMGMTQEELGLEIGTTGNSIYLYETAQRMMKVDKLFDIADALMVTPAELCPERFVDKEKMDPRLFQIGEQMKKLSEEKRVMAYQAMAAMVAGFLMTNP